MRILVTYPDTRSREVLFPTNVRSRLEALGGVRWNEHDDQFTPDELREHLRDATVCVTGWGSPTLTDDVLGDETPLELVSHVGGSVASIASPALYDRGIPVCSANHVMAPFVAEGILAYVLSALRSVPDYDAALSAGEWPTGLGDGRSETLFGATVGFVGLGAVGRALLGLLEPFDVSVNVYDPYITSDDLSSFEFAERTDLETALRTADVVTIHASLTPETVHLLDADRLATIPDGGLVVNAARGAIVDEAALVEELRTGRLSAALDVFEEEPLPTESPLRDLDSAVLGPHVAGSPSVHRLADAAVAEVERHVAGEPLRNAISRERYERMTRDHLAAV